MNNCRLKAQYLKGGDDKDPTKWKTSIPTAEFGSFKKSSLRDQARRIEKAHKTKRAGTTKKVQPVQMTTTRATEALLLARSSRSSRCLRFGTQRFRRLSIYHVRRRISKATVPTAAVRATTVAPMYPDRVARLPVNTVFPSRRVSLRALKSRQLPGLCSFTLR